MNFEEFNFDPDRITPEVIAALQQVDAIGRVAAALEAIAGELYVIRKHGLTVNKYEMQP